jgi:hypothetical protein
MKMGMVVDLEKGVIQVWNKPGIIVEILPFNVVNMLPRISRLEVSRHDQMKEDFNKMNLEQWCVDGRPTLDSTSTFFNYSNCTNDSLSEGDLKEKKMQIIIFIKFCQ